MSYSRIPGVALEVVYVLSWEDIWEKALMKTALQQIQHLRHRGKCVLFGELLTELHRNHRTWTRGQEGRETLGKCWKCICFCTVYIWLFGLVHTSTIGLIAAYSNGCHVTSLVEHFPTLFDLEVSCDPFFWWTEGLLFKSGQITQVYAK